MKCIVGLGNPGEKYKNNRHNVGFMFIDYMVKLLNGYMVKKNKNYLAIQPSNHSAILLAKPLTFMNLSGAAVKKLTMNYELLTTNLYVVHDDLDIPLGKFKIQKGVGPRLHNGVESIEKALGTKDFWRIRIGIDNRPALRSLARPSKLLRRRRREGGIDGETYVLQDFSLEERSIKQQIFPKICSRLRKELLFGAL